MTRATAGELVLYERAGVNGICPSPVCWRSRIALAMKGLDHRRVPIRFTEADRLVAETGSRTVPVLMVDRTPIAGSDEIAAALDDLVPEGRLRDPLSDSFLFGAEAELSHRVTALVAADGLAKLDPADRAYYQETREAQLRRSFAELETMRDVLQLDLAFTIGRLEKDLGDGATFGGDGPNWTDIVVYCHLLRIAFASPRSWPQLPETVDAWWDARDKAWRGICLAPV